MTPSIVDSSTSTSSMMNNPLSFVHVRCLTSEAKCHTDRVKFDFRKEHDGKLLRVVMESDGNNVFTTTNLASLNTRLTRELKNPQVRMMVLESSNPNIFSMGLCPHHLLELSEDERVQLVHQQVAAVRRIHLAPVPTLAYISGKCYAAGAVMAAACDVRLLAENARMSFSEAKVGLTLPAPAGRLIRTISGPTAMFELGVLGRNMTPELAKEYRLATDVVPDRQAAEEWIAGKLARVCRLSRSVILVTLEQSKIDMKNSFDKFLFEMGNPQSPGARQYRRFLTDEFIGEGMQAYLEKRDAKWNS